MLTIVNIVFDGVIYGMILFMMAVGLSVTMGLMRVTNLAHGGFAMIGGAAAHWLCVDQGVNFWLATILAVLITVLVSFGLEAILYRRIYKMDALQQVLATIGIVFLMIASVNALLGSTILQIPLPSILTGTINLDFRVLPAHRILVILSGLSVLLLLYYLIERTRFGICLRAAVDNRAAAASIGINTSRIYMLTFALGGGLAALGGILGAEMLPIDANYPLRYIVLVLIVVVVGGPGSIFGSFAAAIGLAVVDTATRYLAADFGTVFFYLAVIGVLAMRTDGRLEKA